MTPPPQGPLRHPDPSVSLAGPHPCPPAPVPMGKPGARGHQSDQLIARLVGRAQVGRSQAGSEARPAALGRGKTEASVIPLPPAWLPQEKAQPSEDPTSRSYPPSFLARSTAWDLQGRRLNGCCRGPARVWKVGALVGDRGGDG